jgi:Double-GTPase 1
LPRPYRSRRGSQSGNLTKMVLAQVRIVQLLSDLLRPPFTQLRRRLAVIISAWDLVPEGFTPDRWLSTQMPLVDQFLKANGDLFRTNLYGVSAQGSRSPIRGQAPAPDRRQTRADHAETSGNESSIDYEIEAHCSLTLMKGAGNPPTRARHCKSP